MSKILKNTTNLPIDLLDTGIEIAASSQYTIIQEDYLLFAASSDVIVFIGNGNLIVNDGTIDLSISDGIDLVKGFFPSEIAIAGVSKTNGKLDVNAEINISASAQTISSKIRTDFSAVKQDLPRNSAAILDYYTYTGSGTFYGFATYFNSSQVIVELEIDGETIFSIRLDKLDDFKSEDSAIPWIKMEEKQLSYEPRFGIKYNNSVKLKAKASSNSSSKDMKVNLVNIEKVL